MPSAGFEPAISEIKDLQPTPLTVRPLGLAAICFYDINVF
jgi:hypothetical protein